MPDTVRAITLDLDDTLWPVAPVIERAELALQAWLQQHAPHTAQQFPIERMRRLRAEVGVAHPGLAHDLTALRLHTTGRALRESGEDPALAPHAFEVFMAQRNRVDLYDEVLPALERLAARYPLLALSNGNADVQQVGLGHCFVGRIGAREAGVAKPDPRIFAAACEALALPAAAVLHVGDDWQADVLGARAAGLHSAWLHRGASLPAAAAEAPAQGVHWLLPDLQALADALGA
jgi:HAD superfamily hydrolase (TIGR01549 family)